MTSRIELRAVRQEDLQSGDPDYHVYAGAQLVGRIYRHVLTGTNEQWFWGVNAVMLDATVGRPMHGYAVDVDDAKGKLRDAFEAWLAWARAIAPDDLKYPHIARQVAKMQRPSE